MPGRGDNGRRMVRPGVLRRLPVAAALCAGLVAGQDAVLKAAVVKCVGEDATGNCECAGTSCSTDSRFQGRIGTWDVSGVAGMHRLFYTANSGACTIYCDFNGDISNF